MRYSYIFWDWNGTLLDDARASWLAVNDMLSARNLPHISFQTYRDYIDIPIVRFYEKVMDISKETMEGLSVEFNRLYRMHLDLSLSIDIVSVLESFSQKGVKQYIFSSSNNKIIKPLLDKLGISKYFEAVLGSDDCYVGSKAERTLQYMLSNKIPASQSLFIGDMVHDSEVAEYVGADCMLVSSGHQCEKALNVSGNKVFSSVSSLAEFFNKDLFTTEVSL